MRVTFLGAAEMVTGSCYLLEIENTKLLVDCGLFQGGSESEELNFKGFDFNPAEIDYVLLTHAHVDHSGRIPLLAKHGFKGRIIATMPTVKLCEIMLPDSAFIQESEIEWINRKHERAGKPPMEPLYKVQDALASLDFFSGVDYNTLVTLGNNVTVRFRNAGHILGSAIIEMWVRDKGQEFKLVFSGDLGNKGVAIMQDPAIIEDADYLFVESTYGNRLHNDVKNKALVLMDIILETIERKGTVVIPSFAIERTQEILYELNKLKENKTIPDTIKNIPVYVDSPLAINATKIFAENVSYLDDDARALLDGGDDPFDFPNLVFTETAEESKAINFENTSKIIISASGMCEAGRIKHHLKHNLWKKNNCVIFVGYQARETLGRRILDGEKSVKIFGEEIVIKSKIYSIEGFSGHADQKGLLEWVGGFKNKPRKIFLTHGEDEALTEFSKLISERFGIDNEIAKLGQTIELTAVSDRMVVEERYEQHKQNILDDVELMRDKANDVLDKLQHYIKSKDNITVDRLLYLLEKIGDNIEELDKETR